MYKDEEVKEIEFDGTKWKTFSPEESKKKLEELEKYCKEQERKEKIKKILEK